MTSADLEDKTVRFSSVKQEISPEQSFQSQPVGVVPGREPRDDIPEEAQEELRNLAMSLQKSRLQTKRLGDFAFDPVSLPVSRVSLYDYGNCMEPKPSAVKTKRHYTERRLITLNFWGISFRNLPLIQEALILLGSSQ
jgi:hypothetical protein